MDKHDDRLYSEEHAWVRRKDGGICEVGLSGHAIEAFLGISYFRFSTNVSEHVAVGDPVAEIESRKAADVLVCPVSGTVQSIGFEIEKDPSCIEDCDGDMVLLVIREDEAQPRAAMMTREQYDKIVEGK